MHNLNISEKMLNKAPSDPADIKNIRMLFITMVLLVIYLSIAFPQDFISRLNLQSVMLQFSELGIFALAMGLSILLAGIDLSIISVANLSAIFAAMYLSNQDYAAIDIGDYCSVAAIAVATGLGCGLINGMLVGYLEIPAILATLATMTIFKGLAIGITGGSSISGMPEEFSYLGNGTCLGIPVTFIIFMFFTLILWFILEKTPFGLKVYLTGTNIKAAKYSGIDGRAVNFKAYVMMSVISAIGGLIILSKTNAANPDYGTSYILTTILIVAMSGISVLGGKGKIIGIVLSVIILQLISSAMSLYMFDISGSNFFKDFAWGLMLILVIALMNFKFKRKGCKNGSEN